MKPSQPTLPAIIKPTEIVTNGHEEFLQAMVKIKAFGGHVESSKRGKGNASWILTVRWPKEKSL